MTSHPKPPSRIGKTTRRKYINGNPMTYTVQDEIVPIPQNNPATAIYLQMLQFEDDGRKEMPLCYYMVGHRPRAKGKWLYGQFASMIRKEDFEQIIVKAREKGWIT